MNKVFFYGKNAQPYVAACPIFLDNAKAAFTAYLGPEREGSICSSLDAADYVFFDPSLKRTSGHGVLKTRVVNKLRGLSPVFMRQDFIRQFSKFFKANMPGRQKASVRAAKELFFDPSVITRAYCESHVASRDGSMAVWLYLPIGADNILYVHELLHTISARQVRLDDMPKPRWAAKKGLCEANDLDALNEMFTEHLAVKIDDFMRKNGLPLLGQPSDRIYGYDIMLPLVNPLFNAHQAEFTEAYLGPSIKPIADAVGFDNLCTLNRQLGKLFEFNYKHLGVFEKYMRWYVSRLSGASEQEQAELLQVYKDRLAKFDLPEYIEYEMHNAIHGVVFAVDKCLEHKKDSQQNENVAK